MFFKNQFVEFFRRINDIFSLPLKIDLLMSSLRRLIPLIYAIIIIFTLTCIFTRAFTRNFLDQLSTFDYPRTYVELYFLMLFDSLMFIIQPWIIRKKYPLIVVQLVIYAYSLSKFLVFYEWNIVRKITTPYQFDRFDYLAMIFIPLFSIGGIFIWMSVSVEPERSTTDELTPLLASTEEDQDVQIKQTSGSWWRILKLGKPEWKLYIIGFILLLFAASGMSTISHQRI